MRKKSFFAACMLTMVMGVCSCSSENADNETAWTKESVTTESVTTESVTKENAATENVTTESQTVSQELTEEHLKWLIDENIYCNLYVFGMHSLPREEEEIDYQGRKLHQVDTDIFVDFATFEEYLRSVFCSETAQLYLYKNPNEENPQYVNVDGKLYVDISSEGGRGYFVDWSEYTFEIKTQSEGKCEFTVTAMIEEPAEVPVKEPYTVECEAVFEDGRWVLARMIY